MSQGYRFGAWDFLLLLLILLLSSGLRLFFLLVLAEGGQTSGPILVTSPSPIVQISDGEEIRGKAKPTQLDVLIHNLRTKHEFAALAPFATKVERTAHVSPGYPWLLGWVARVVRDDRLDQGVRWGQLVLGSLTPVLYFLFARRAFGSRVLATLVGVLCALHPFWILDIAALNEGTLSAFVLGMILYTGLVGSTQGGALVSLLYGLGLAGLALLRAPVLPFAFVGVMWFLLRCRLLESGWIWALLAFLGFAIGLGPWTLRNFQTYREPVPVVNSAYLHLWMGNNSASTGGPQSEETVLKTLADRRGLPVTQVRDELAQMKQNARYRVLASDVSAEVSAKPAQFLQHRLETAVAFFLGEAWLKERRLVQLTEDPEVVQSTRLGRHHVFLLLSALLLMFGLGFLGWRWSQPWKEELRPATLALLWIPLPYLIGHADTLHGPRLPLDGIILVFAAFALACSWPSLRQHLLAGPSEDSNAGRQSR